MSAEGATDALTLSPLQGFVLKRHLSTACGRGYTMPPLRGSIRTRACLDSLLAEHFTGTRNLDNSAFEEGRSRRSSKMLRYRNLGATGEVTPIPTR